MNVALGVDYVWLSTKQRKEYALQAHNYLQTQLNKIEWEYIVQNHDMWSLLSQELVEMICVYITLY